MGSSKLLFRRINSSASRKVSELDACYLVEDTWDDFGFKTLFHLLYVDRKGGRHDIGNLKILQKGMISGRSPVPQQFDKLDDSYATLGLVSSYYETLVSLGQKKAKQILQALRDIALDQRIYEQVQEEEAFKTSLMRGVREMDVSRFRDIVLERASLTPFDFTYKLGLFNGGELTFKVVPHVVPPTNIHTIIGRNGVGKTHLIKSMLAWLCDGEDTANPNTSFAFGSTKDEYGNDTTFANLVHVAFSAFDEIDLPSSPNGTRTGIKVAYVGLRKPLRKSRLLRKRGGEIVAKQATRPVKERLTELKTIAELGKEFVTSTRTCLDSSRRANWLSVMSILESDPVFELMSPRKLAEIEVNEFDNFARRLFKKASSGHKIVLLTLARLVELVEERTLVLIDEPEAHLHPPLQAALIRALSFLLAKRNGLAILVTHSPVMLQEVPRDCVWLLDRDGIKTRARRSEIETFAENFGVLTREVFRLEVTASGYHSLLSEAASTNGNFDAVLRRFRDHVGSEGRAMLRSMLAKKN